MEPNEETTSGAALAPKADLGKRFVAIIIDGVLAGFVGFLFGLIWPALSGLISGGYFLVRDGLDASFMDGRSIGKKLMNLRPVKLDGSPMDLEASMRRNWMFAVGGLSQAVFAWGIGNFIAVAAGLVCLYELYRVLTDKEGRRWGDDLANTKVIDD